MACSDVDVSFGNVLIQYDVDQTSSDGLTAGTIAQNEVLANPKSVVNGNSNPLGDMSKLIGIDFLLDNNAEPLEATATFSIYFFKTAPQDSGGDIVAADAFSTVTDASLLGLLGKVDISAAQLLGQTDKYFEFYNESDISEIIKPDSDTNYFYACVVLTSSVSLTIATGATLTIKYKFEGVAG